MKIKIFYFIILCISAKSYSQSIYESRIWLEDGIELEYGTTVFNKNAHKIDSVKVGDWYKVVLIDDKFIFGSDDMLPKIELNYIKVLSDGYKISLETTCMYNPNGYELKLRNDQIEVVNYSDKKIITGHFSDGAGSYKASWLLYKQSSLRICMEESD